MNMSLISVPGELSMMCTDVNDLKSGESRLRNEESETKEKMPSLKEIVQHSK